MSLGAHHEKVMAKLCDIDKDTDALIKMEAEESMNGAYDSGMLAGMLANKNNDNDIWAYLANCRNNGAWGDGDGLMFLLLVLLMGGGPNRWRTTSSKRRCLSCAWRFCPVPKISGR